MQQHVELEEPKVAFAGAFEGVFHAEKKLDDISIKLLENTKKLRDILKQYKKTQRYLRGISKKYKVFCSIAH
jgi:hypothetical protein